MKLISIGRSLHTFRTVKRLSAITLCVASLSLTQPVLADSVSNETTLDSLLRQGKYEQVIKQLDNIKNKTPEQYNLLVSALLNTDLDDAEDAAEDFINAYKNDYRAYLTHANVMGAQASNSIFSALGYAEKAKASLEKAVEVAPDNVQTYSALLQFHLVAPGIAGGDMDEAKKLVAQITALDATEGEFANASYLQADDKTQQAKAIFTQLSEQPETRVRALYALGNMYMQKGDYANARDAFLPLMSIELPAAEKADETAWSKYSEDKFRVMYGLYRVGHIAVETGQHNNEGIEALKLYLQEFQHTDIDTGGLPSLNWANLRLAEIYINNSEKENAKQALSVISEEDNSRFNKIYKKLKKKV